MMGRTFCVFLLCLLCVYAADEGDPCSKNGEGGVCKNIRNCQAAIEDIKNRRPPQICGFSGTDPVVCCVDKVVAPVTTARPPVATTSTKRPVSTTEYVPPYYDYHDNTNSNSQSKGCDAIPANKTSPKTGQKAWDKCIDYQEQLVYPCIKGMALTGELTRVDRCGHKADELIIGGVDAGKKEFPHMVLLGFGDTAEKAQWLCGGTLISDRFILTAGHCTSTRELGPVSFAIIGALKRTDQVDSSRVYKIKQIHKNPDYKSPKKYNDIALLETERQMQLDQFAVPACLHVGDMVDDKIATATGWGAVQYRGPNADNLQKVTLKKFSDAECAEKFPPARNFAQGFDTRTQICYGDKTMSKDTCQGDSGGPLQIKSKSIYCMYLIIGVTSFGKACGFVGDPGIYTRVAPFVPWIESVVWP